MLRRKMINLDLGDPEGNQGWWEGHRKSQETPDLFKGNL
jgi:hypothetical protein